MFASFQLFHQFRENQRFDDLLNGEKKGAFCLAWSIDEFQKHVCCCLTFLKRGRARFSNEGKSTTYCPTVYSRLPWDGPGVSLRVQIRRMLLKTARWKRAASLIWTDRMATLLPDSGQVAPLSCHRDYIKADSPASRPDLLCVKAFDSHSWWHQSLTGLLDQGGFSHTCNQKTTQCREQCLTVKCGTFL